MRHLLVLILTLFTTVFFCSAQSTESIKIAALHPFLGEIASYIGSDHVKVVNLLKPNGNLHSFEPTPDLMIQAAGARYILASGKKLEPYLPALADSLNSGISSSGGFIVNLGEAIPDVPSADFAGTGAASPHNDATDKRHHHGSCDPHWWHTPTNMKRAARRICALLCQEDPQHKVDYQQALKSWNKKMDSLNAWARTQLADIPDQNRILVTGHSAMGHFCKEYDLIEIPILGTGREEAGDPARLGDLLQQLKNHRVKAVFPEYSVNPKALEEIAKALGAPLAQPLITDGLSPDYPTFEAMFRANVNNICKSLVP